MKDPYFLAYTSYSSFLLFTFFVELNRFPELSGTSGIFPGLSSPRKCQNKIPGLSRFSRTHTNPSPPPPPLGSLITVSFTNCIILSLETPQISSDFLWGGNGYFRETQIMILKSVTMDSTQSSSKKKPWSLGWLIAAGAYPGFCSMKWLEVLFFLFVY